MREVCIDRTLSKRLMVTSRGGHGASVHDVRMIPKMMGDMWMVLKLITHLGDHWAQLEQ